MTHQPCRRSHIMAIQHKLIRLCHNSQSKLPRIGQQHKKCAARCPMLARASAQHPDFISPISHLRVSPLQNAVCAESIPYKPLTRPKGDLTVQTQQGQNRTIHVPESPWRVRPASRRRQAHSGARTLTARNSRPLVSSARTPRTSVAAAPDPGHQVAGNQPATP